MSLTIGARSPRSASSFNRRIAITRPLDLGTTWTPPPGEKPDILCCVDGISYHSFEVTAYRWVTLPLGEIDDGGVEIEAMMLACARDMRCTSSADEVERRPVALNAVGRKPWSSA